MTTFPSMECQRPLGPDSTISSCVESSSSVTMPPVCQRDDRRAGRFAHGAATIAPTPGPAARRRCETGSVTLLEPARAPVESRTRWPRSRAPRAGSASTPDEAEALLRATGATISSGCCSSPARCAMRGCGIRSPRRDHLLAQGVHPAHDAVPRPLPLLRLRRHPRRSCSSCTSRLYMSPEQVLAVARQGAALGCKEALLTLGDRPEDRWPEGARLARRARLRVDPRLRRRDGAARSRPRPGCSPT